MVKFTAQDWKEMKAFDARMDKMYLAIWKIGDTNLRGSMFVIAKSLNKAHKKLQAHFKARSIDAEVELLREYIPF